MNTSIFLLIVLLTVMMVVLIALTVYLLDKLRVLESSLISLSKLDFRSGQNQRATTTNNHSAIQDPYFYGLTGQKLWQVLEANADSDFTQVEIEEVRSRFIAVLSRALTVIKDTHPNQLASTITEDSDGWGVFLRTLRGSITVWIPVDIVSQLQNLTNLAMSSNERELVNESDRIVEAIFQRINASATPQGTKTAIAQSLTI
ncbi:MAG: hypothetical protein P8N94_14120 [Gammaproteobacteria bacterium]|nr:hypothetical protein [Gammaproteobacteria bacterium]MDG2339099.1 hypothetical protein [Gammaproteobacteria bacterium]